MKAPRPPRLEHIWVKKPVFFISAIVKDRRPILTTDTVFNILAEQLRCAKERYGWAVGEFVVMPDHIHFFTREARENPKSLGEFIGQIKSWSAKRIKQMDPTIEMPLWQEGFYDRLMRNEGQWEEKRLYMLDNPVRASLVQRAEEWPFKGDLDMFGE